MEHPKNVDEDLVDDQKAERHADGIAAPIQQEQGVVRVPHVSWKNHCEGQQLREDITEEELEVAQQTAAKHESDDPHLKQGMHDPEYVVNNLRLLAHARLFRVADEMVGRQNCPLAGNGTNSEALHCARGR